MESDGRDHYRLISRIYLNTLLNEEREHELLPRPYGKNHDVTVSIQYLNYKYKRLSKRKRERKKLEKLLKSDADYAISTEEYVEILNELMETTNNIIFDIVPIVASTAYQNAIRTAYIVLYNINSILSSLKEEAVDKPDSEKAFNLIVILIDCIVSGLQILEAMTLIQKHNGTLNEYLQNFRNYISQVEIVCLYAIIERTGVNLWTFLKERKDNLNPFIIKRLTCLICLEFVTFNGCQCTNWELGTSDITDAEHYLLMSPVEDGPSCSDYDEVVPPWSVTIKNLHQTEKEQEDWYTIDNKDKSDRSSSDDAYVENKAKETLTAVDEELLGGYADFSDDENQQPYPEGSTAYLVPDIRIQDISSSSSEDDLPFYDAEDFPEYFQNDAINNLNNFVGLSASRHNLLLEEEAPQLANVSDQDSD